MEGIARKYLNRYDMVFLLEPLNVQSNNGFRLKQDIASRKKHYAILKSIYPQYVEIPTAPIDERLKLILNKLLS